MLSGAAVTAAQLFYLSSLWLQGTYISSSKHVSDSMCRIAFAEQSNGSGNALPATATACACEMFTTTFLKSPVRAA